MRKSGKIDRKNLNLILNQNTGRASAAVKQGPAFGVDTAIIELSPSRSLITASDPASYISALGVKESAWLTVILAANDVATSGFLPQYAQFVFNLTHKITDDELAQYLGYIHRFCNEMDIAITGGHTGFDNLGPSTLAGGTTLFAVAETSEVKSSAFAKPGQQIIATKTAALSSAAILAKSFPNHTKKNLGNKKYDELAGSFYETSVLPEVKALKNEPDILQQISAMHDVTEGGTLGAVYELCAAAGIGVTLKADDIFVGSAQREICSLFDIDPLRSTGAGSLIIVCEKGAADSIIRLLQARQIEAHRIGETRAADEGLTVRYGNREQELVYQEKDPYWDAFFNAINEGLN